MCFPFSSSSTLFPVFFIFTMSIILVFFTYFYIVFKLIGTSHLNKFVGGYLFWDLSFEITDVTCWSLFLAVFRCRTSWLTHGIRDWHVSYILIFLSYLFSEYVQGISNSVFVFDVQLPWDINVYLVGCLMVLDAFPMLLSSGDIQHLCRILSMSRTQSWLF